MSFALKIWYIQPILAFDNSKENIHITINVSNVELVDTFLTDLEASVQKAKTLKSSELAASLRKGSFPLNSAELSSETLTRILSMVGIQGIELPERMAQINEALNTLPPEFREGLLIEYVNDLFRYREDRLRC